MGVKRQTGRLLARILTSWLIAIFGAVASLMFADKVRRMVRGQNVPPLKRRDHDPHTVGDGSELTIYTSGEALFDDMLTAIEQAQHRILLESYIIKGDATGKTFKRALIAAAQRGVDVYVIYDGFANLVVRPSFFRFPPGVSVLRYPLWSGLASISPRRWGRDHRKILVVDDTVGFVGGYNIGSLYATQWRDTHLRVRGPAVWDLDNAFVDFWNMQKPASLPMLDQIGSTGWKPHIRAHRNVQRQLLYPIRGMYLEAIDRAHVSIDITAAYFIPDHDILDALIDAAQHRGVRVRILVPKVSNHVVTDWLSRGFYGRLLRAGVEIYRYTDHMVHAKTATIDNQWSTVGTANIDRLSLMGNYEVNLEITDPGVAEQMEKVFDVDLSNSRELTLAEWDSRSVAAKLSEVVLTPLRPLL